MADLKVLELFCGTKSFTKIVELEGHMTFTVDFDDKFKPDLCKDILELNENDIPFRPDIVWASPPCTEYSIAKTRGVRDLDYADRVVEKTLELIDILKPKVWIMENPQTGLLKTRNFMLKIPYTDTSYCKYGFEYRKHTRFWNNIGLRLEVCKKDCDYVIDGRHITSFGNTRPKYNILGKHFTRKMRYRIPEKLCISVFNQCKIFIDSGSEPILSFDQATIFDEEGK